ncbi:MAG TPA: DinB family protein [Bryobacteraceae bacterium]
MMMKSGRAEAGEYAAYAQADIDLVEGDDILVTLAAQIEQTLALFEDVDDTLAGTVSYEPGKWTLKQIVHHLSDDERIFAYRCLCLARNDLRPLEGFDEKQYEQHAGSNELPLSELVEELGTVREGTLALLRSLHDEAWMRRGTVNGYSATVRGLAFHIAGHELHHARMIREKYLPLVRSGG